MLLAATALRREAGTGQPYEETLHMHLPLPITCQWSRHAGISSLPGVPEAVIHELRHREAVPASASGNYVDRLGNPCDALTEYQLGVRPAGKSNHW